MILFSPFLKENVFWKIFEILAVATFVLGRDGKEIKMNPPILKMNLPFESIIEPTTSGSLENYLN